MNVKIKNSYNLKLKIAQCGYSEIKLSLKLKKCRQFIHAILKRKATSPGVAKEISELLNLDFDEYFELVEKGA